MNKQMRVSIQVANYNKKLWCPRSLLQAGNWGSRSVEEEGE